MNYALQNTRTLKFATKDGGWSSNLNKACLFYKSSISTLKDEKLVKVKVIPARVVIA